MTRAPAVLVSVLAVLAGVLAGVLVAPPAGIAAEPRSGHVYEQFTPQPDDPRVLRQAWRRWQRLDASTYVLRVQVSCFCLEQPVIETRVVRGKVVSVTHQGQSRQLRRKGYDMDRLYRILQAAYPRAHRVWARYSTRGVPRSFYIDRSLLIADEEVGYTVRLRGLRG